MTRIIAISSQKGGPGKTTLATNIAAILARHWGRGRTLLIDCDPQANATSIFLGADAAFGPNPPPNLYHVLCSEARADNVIQHAQLKLKRGPSPYILDILPSHISAAAAEIELVSKFERERRLRRWLAPILPNYNYIILDCPPSLGLITINALMAATEVVVPVEPGYFPLVGIGLLKSTIEQLQMQSNPQLRITGVVMMKEDRTRMSSETREVLVNEFPGLILPTVPRRSMVPESQASWTDLLGYVQPDDELRYESLPDVTKAFVDITEEIVRRGKKTTSI